MLGHSFSKLLDRRRLLSYDRGLLFDTLGAAEGSASADGNAQDGFLDVRAAESATVGKTAKSKDAVRSDNHTTRVV